MRKLQQTTQVLLAMVLATVLAVGIVGAVQGQVGSGSNVDLPAVTVVQRPYPNVAVHPGGIVSYEVEVRTNRSNGVGTVLVHMNFNPSAVQVVSADFFEKENDTLNERTAGDAWVYHRDDALGKLSYQTGRVSNNKSIIARIILYVKAEAPVDAMVADRLSYEWQSESGNTKMGLGNQTILAVGASDVQQPHYALTVQPEIASVGINRTLTSESIFAAGEPVALWYNSPQGYTFNVGVMAADYNGKVGFSFDTWSLGNGAYSVVAHGNWTGFEAVGMVTIGDAPAPMPVVEQPQPEGPQQAPGCLECHAKHNVQAPHPPKPTCTDCHGESKPALEKSCVECHTSKSHQNVVQMPRVSNPVCSPRFRT